MKEEKEEKEEKEMKGAKKQSGRMKPNKNDVI